eukprot:3810313-Amphidinium_carterae.1
MGGRSTLVPSGNVASRPLIGQATPSAGSGNHRTVTPPRTKYVTESELEARLAEHMKQVEDKLRKFDRPLTGLHGDKKEVGTKAGGKEEAAAAPSAQQLSMRCSKAEAALARLEEQCSSLQQMHQEVDTRYERCQHEMDKLLAEHTASINEIVTEVITLVQTRLEIPAAHTDEALCGRKTPRAVLPKTQAPSLADCLAALHEHDVSLEGPLSGRWPSFGLNR